MSDPPPTPVDPDEHDRHQVVDATVEGEEQPPQVGSSRKYTLGHIIAWSAITGVVVAIFTSCVNSGQSAMQQIGSAVRGSGTSTSAPSTPSTAPASVVPPMPTTTIPPTPAPALGPTIYTADSNQLIETSSDVIPNRKLLYHTTVAAQIDPSTGTVVLTSGITGNLAGAQDHVYPAPQPEGPPYVATGFEVASSVSAPGMAVDVPCDKPPETNTRDDTGSGCTAEIKLPLNSWATVKATFAAEDALTVDAFTQSLERPFFVPGR